LRYLESEVVITCVLHTRSSSAQEVRAITASRASGALCRREVVGGTRLAVIIFEPCLCFLCLLWRDASAPGGWSMKTVLSFLTTVLFSCALIGPAVAQQRSPGDTSPPPRGVEGPEIRKEAPKGTPGADTPKTEKKSPRAGSQKPKDTANPPMGIEGPEMRKQEPKGTRGVDTPKTGKKGTRARSQKPRHSDAPPKAHAAPEIKQDGGKKSQ